MPTWTDPRTWTTNELVTAAIMNTHIRDNLNATYPHLVVRKTADESVASSAVLQDDDVLFLPVLANEVWQIVWSLRVTGNSTADFKFGFTFPTAGELTANFALTQGAAALVVGTGSSTSPLNSWSPDIGGSGFVSQNINALYVGGANAGNVKLQWAQATSDAGATIVKANSTLWAVKLA